MTILVLDPRWPDMIPLGIASRIRGPVEFTAEVPVSVRWALADTAPESGPGWLVTTDPQSPEVRSRAADEEVLTVPSLSDPVHQAVETMRRARARGEWERAMTHESLLPYLEEEAGEFAEAVRKGLGDKEMRAELSDVLLQVLFHAELARERGAFDFADVAQAFTDKMKSRAPYLFDGSAGIVGVEEQERLWAEGKRREAR
ncbi:MazG nucleotide pyrophosphohydrolase domain-containing protein [Corynebacterium sp.]|uniref:MazG nucleotide pyrophosphohydrolase domain-containing protein n=1 Tax=Corynebacterium sp. TaxID=1720 RepID=UPI002A90FC99|nr:MazG nucleotide pyrophosphohydrolase domain-containing protein [Corynebacterium sp.]MDY5785389.1 MazG nucleotide pyrophosphohydrolase domain-containing protein [Corynebacterium sp.]